ncbi:MAG: phoU [Verrucomicrobiaceae bacterium]|nr:phoU [Verrucomicrobiaceae bacterium]
MSPNDHILSAFSDSLNRLRENVLTMGSIARKNLANAMRGLLERDTDLCNQTIADDQDVNMLEKSIDKAGMDILVRFQPMAYDLRQVMGTLRVANNLERISDQASSIAKRARKINLLPELPELALIQTVYQLASAQVERAMTAFANGQAERAAEIRSMDKEIDNAEKALDQALLEVMESQQGGLEAYLHLIFVGRFLERVGDHAKNICEDTIFIEKAEDIRFLKKRKQAEAAQAPMVESAESV